LVALLQPIDIRRDPDGAGFDAAMIGVGRAVSRSGHCQRVVEEDADIVIHRPLIRLEREGVIAALIKICWAIARWQLSVSTATMVPLSDSKLRNFGTAVISLDLASVAAYASNRR
jgi:hypothetical protein